MAECVNRIHLYEEGLRGENLLNPKKISDFCRILVDRLENTPDCTHLDCTEANCPVAKGQISSPDTKQ